MNKILRRVIQSPLSLNLIPSIQLALIRFIFDKSIKMVLLLYFGIHYPIFLSLVQS